MRDFSEFLPLPVLCLSVVHLYLIVFLFFSSSAVMTVKIGPKLKAADVQRMLFITSEPQVQPLRHVFFKDLPSLPFVMQDQMVDFSIYVKKTSHL